PPTKSARYWSAWSSATRSCTPSSAPERRSSAAIGEEAPLGTAPDEDEDPDRRSGPAGLTREPDQRGLGRSQAGQNLDGEGLEVGERQGAHDRLETSGEELERDQVPGEEREQSQPQLPEADGAVDVERGGPDDARDREAEDPGAGERGREERDV